VIDDGTVEADEGIACRVLIVQGIGAGGGNGAVVGDGTVEITIWAEAVAGVELGTDSGIERLVTVVATETVGMDCPGKLATVAGVSISEVKFEFSANDSAGRARQSTT